MTRSLLLLVLCFVICFAASAVGIVFGPDAWFAALIKPSFQPPNGWFGPVWTLLYALMSVALWRVWRLPASPLRRLALVCFAVQLVLNAAWSPLFFGAHSIGGALVVLALLIPSVATAIVLFWRIDRIASALLWPYLAWLCFALLLNAAIWQLNG